MRKIWLAVLASAVLLAAGCGGSGGDDPKPPPPRDHFVVVQDVLPWDLDVLPLAMAEVGITEGTGSRQYEVITSADLVTATLDAHRDVLVVPSIQYTTYYAALDAQMSKITTFVENGGVIIFSVCDWTPDADYSIDASGLTLLGGVTLDYIPETYNSIEDPGSALMAGLPAPMFGSWASHTSILNLPAGAHVFAAGDSGGNATLVEFPMGSGKVIMSGMTLEIGYFYEWDAAPLYPRLFAYAIGDI